MGKKRGDEMSKLFPFQIGNASRRVGEYFWRGPHEEATGKDEDAFNRAKKETIKVIRDVLDGVERLEFSDFEHQLKRGLMQRVERTNFWSDCNANDDLLAALLSATSK